MTSYKYERLEDRQIRLLDLHPGGYNSPLKGTLRHISIDSPSDYDALSYAWGNSEACSSLFCNNRQVKMTSSLNLALLRLRDTQEQRTLWIDQLCINQANISERNHQVRLMGDIYSKARQVDVWLGEEDADTEMGLGLIPRLLAAFPESSVDTDQDEEFPDMDNKYGLPFVCSPAWNAFAQLFTRPYFRRVWIVQEVALGSSVTVYCGPHTVKWDDLTKAGLCVFIDSNTYEFQAHKAVQMLRAYRKQKTVQKDSQMADLMFSSYNLQCFDPRDKIYGMLGLMVEGLNGVLKPDYNASVQQVYCDFTVYMLLRDRSLAFLCNVLYPKRLEGFPSWVPDWTAHASVRKSLGSQTAIHGTSAGGENSTIEFSRDKQELYLEGTTIGKVEKLGTIFPEEQLKENNHIVPEWEEIAKSVLPYHTGEKYPAVLWRTLIASDSKDSSQSSEVLQNLYESWNHWIVSIRHYYISREDPNYKAPPRPPMPSTNIVNPRMEQFKRMIEDTSLGRRIFTTDNGYLGLAPAAAHESDHLCVLSGGPVPFILRKDLSTNKYAMVGECFALGLMHGEGLDTDRFQIQRFGLRWAAGCAQKKYARIPAGLGSLIKNLFHYYRTITYWRILTSALFSWLTTTTRYTDIRLASLQ